MTAYQDILHRSFGKESGEVEHFLVITAPGDMGFKEQVKYIETIYAQKILSLGLPPQTAVFRRIFLSDALNQIDMLQSSELTEESDGYPVAVSIIQQPPMPNSKIALLAYHIESKKPLEKKRLSPQHVLVRKNGLGYLWSTRICSQDTDKSISAALQTRSAFANLINALSSNGGDLYNNCVRTWIYVKNIDIFYKSMVNERRELFMHHGLTQNSHFIASSGIEGASPHCHDLITLDAYSILGLDPRQISYLNDFKMLCAAKEYNVTFERGVRIAYADRSHCFISGTASIDDQGNILHPRSVIKQLDRTLENIEALLHSGNATLEDMMYMIVYLRDPADFNYIQARLSQRLPRVVTVIVKGPVCRPEWLIEIEGVAVVPNNQPLYPSF